ncbi:hypothetical protein R1sor_021459 [Riccia sorocarpa]|uniref:Uncharacterized protein n=1 Tax=Riccia sorocarpa TaxID=122646 RepID=A0ABD3GHW0_9MARC
MHWQTQKSQRAESAKAEEKGRVNVKTTLQSDCEECLFARNTLTCICTPAAISLAAEPFKLWCLIPGFPVLYSDRLNFSHKRVNVRVLLDKFKKTRGTSSQQRDSNGWIGTCHSTFRTSPTLVYRIMKRKSNGPHLDEPTSAEKHLRVMVLVSRKSKSVLYIECGKDFVDILLSILIIPVGAILKRLDDAGLSTEVKNGLFMIYASLKSLEASALTVDKEVLLEPSVSATTSQNFLLLQNPTAFTCIHPGCSNLTPYRVVRETTLF